MNRNNIIRYVTLTVAASAMAYTLYRTVKTINKIDDVLDETYGNEYDTDYNPYLVEDNYAK